jgi:pimeloyl-ACP methyl ester carboxylesterase
MVSAIATRNRHPAEIFIGGAGDEHSRLVLSYAEARRARLRGERDVHYLPHWKLLAAARLAEDLSRDRQEVALVGHSWGADTAVQAVRRLAGAGVFLIGADPVAKPLTRITARDTRPRAAEYVVHIDAAPQAYDRSDIVKAAGFLTGGGVPRTFSTADTRIATRLNHWNFAGMMKAPGEDGRSAEDWLQDFPALIRQPAG